MLENSMKHICSKKLRLADDSFPLAKTSADDLTSVRLNDTIIKHLQWTDLERTGGLRIMRPEMRLI